MSMKSWTEEGYGYRLETGSNMKNIVDFIVDNTRELQKNTKNGYVFNFSEEDIKNMYNCEGLFDLAEYTDDPVPWVIADIINNIEGTELLFKGYQDDAGTDQEAMLGIAPVYPWYTPRYTKEKCDELLKKYADILGITEKPDFFEAEYYG